MIGFYTFESEMVTASVLTVGKGPGNYSTIQDAINASGDGDTVFVYNGTYHEHISIEKSINLTGENILGKRPVIDGCGDPHVVYVSNVTHFNMSGFEVINSSMGVGYSGIYIISSSNVNISNNMVHDNCFGVYIASSSLINVQENEIYYNFAGIWSSGSSNNTFIDNSVHDQIKTGGVGGVGFFFQGSPYYNNKIIGNLVYDNDADGIHLEDEFWNNSIINNTVYNHPVDGIFIGRGTNNFVIDNIVHHNGLGSINPRGGIVFGSSINNAVTGNTVHDNEHGIMLRQSGGQPSENNTVADNTCSDNEYGIYLDRSDNNNVTTNTVHSNTGYGIYLSDSSDNVFHHNNIVNNANQVYLDTSNCFNNIWDDGTGEGNYWSDYGGVDMNGDGVGDTEIPHPIIDHGDGYFRLDYYPLVSPVGNYIFLYEGWNLVSLPRIQSDTSPGAVLSSITGCYRTIQWYNSTDTNDPWMHNCTTKPLHLNDFDDIDHLIGFWIYITEPGGVLLEYFGQQPGTPQSISLHSGWNMVGFPSLGSKNRTVALNNLDFGTEVDAIWAFDGATQTWEEVGPSDSFILGKGYWVHAAQECVWQVPL